MFFVNKRKLNMDSKTSISEYQTISILGQCFDNKAVVQLAKHVPSGVMVAIKKFNVDNIAEHINLLESEIILTRQLSHQNILPYVEAFVTGPEVCVVSPLMAYGSCRDLLTRHFNEGLLESAIVLIIKDVLSALAYIHKIGYIHRAIRASHILISVTGKVCLTGMRFACPVIKNGRWQRTIHSFPNTTEKNLNWLSPELLEQNLKGYNEKSDIYSIGIVVCELANGSEPFSAMSKTLMLTEKVRGCIPPLLDKTTIPRDENLDCGDMEITSNILNRRFSNVLHDFVSLCFKWNMADRPSAAQLLNHPIFKTVKKALPLPELLKPVLPLSDRVGYDTDEIENFNMINKLSQLDFYTCEWDF